MMGYRSSKGNGVDGMKEIEPFVIPDPRPRKPSAKIPLLWKCGHMIELPKVVAGYRYCPFCGSKYQKNKLNLIARWLSYSKWASSYRKESVSSNEMMEKKE